MSTAQQRTRLIRLIHVARRDLAMEDDTYRRIVAEKAPGKTSSADCSVPQLEAILAHLKAAGFKVRKPATAKPQERRPLDTSDEAAKARALWLWLHEVGIVRDPSEKALAAFARRTCGVDALQWARRVDKLIEGIKAWAARQLPAALEARLVRLQGAGRVDPRATLRGLLAVAAPTRNPNTFDALRWAWKYLDELERNPAEADRVADAG